MSKYYKKDDVIKCVAQYIMTDAKRDNYYVCGDIEDYIEFTEAILADLPTIEVSEDCISREWVIEKMLAEGNQYDNNDIKHGYHNCELIVYDAPSVVPSRAEGEWIKRTKHTLIAQVNFAYCSECGQPIMHEHTRPLWNYCPNCGAKMKG